MTDSPQPNEIDIAALTGSVKAPESLHRRVQEMVDAATEPERHANRAKPVPLMRWRLAGAFAGSAAAIAAALVAALVLTSSGSGSLTVQQAVALTLSPATMAAPAEDGLHRSQLNVSVEGVAFPYWKERFGWRSAGARHDRLGARQVTTVFYADLQGRRIGYAIVSGRAPSTSGGKVVWHRGVPYRISSEHGATAIAWPRSGRLCVISGRDVSASTLLRLAGWSGERVTAA